MVQLYTFKCSCTYARAVADDSPPSMYLYISIAGWRDTHGRRKSGLRSLRDELRLVYRRCSNPGRYADAGKSAGTNRLRGIQIRAIMRRVQQPWIAFAEPFDSSANNQNAVRRGARLIRASLREECIRSGAANVKFFDRTTRVPAFQTRPTRMCARWNSLTLYLPIALLTDWIYYQVIKNVNICTTVPSEGLKSWLTARTSSFYNLLL